MTDLLQSNLIYLLQKNRNQFNYIQNYLNTTNNEKRCKLDWDPDGQPNLSYISDDGHYYLYDNNTTTLEEWIKQYEFLKQGQYDVILYGLGLTHHLTKLIELNSELNFYIIEPELDLFVEALKIINIDQLMNHPNIKLLEIGNSEEAFQTFVHRKNLYSTNQQVDVFIPFYLGINKENVTDFYELSYQALTADMVSEGFEKKFKTLPYRNTIRNIEHLLTSNSLKILEDKYEGCTALIVGGGPSLEEDIETIRKFRDSLLIIAAGSSIQSLMHFNIIPDLLVSMDPGEANGKLFETVDTRDVPLVFINQIYTPILENHSKNNYHAFFAIDCISDYLFSDLSLEPKFRANPSVSGTAVQIAYYLGAKNILFTGQDLSFPNNQYYSAGANHMSKESLQVYMINGTLQVENVQGNWNTTNYSMKITLENIEDLIHALKEIKDITFINSSSLGAKIKGADFIPLDEAVSSLQLSNYNFSSIKQIAAAEKIENEFELVDVLNRIKQFIEHCDELTANSTYSLSIIRKIDELCRRHPNKAMNQLAKLEEVFSQVTEHELFKTIIPKWNRGLTRDYDKKVINIENEPTMIGKAKLLNEIVVPYIHEIMTSFAELKEEFKTLYDRILPNNTN